MDMNDILAQWDSLQRENVRKQKESGKNQVSHKKANAPTPQEKAAAAEKDFEAKIAADYEKQINPMELWLRRYGTIDKDRMAEDAELHEKYRSRNYLMTMRPQEVLDLHGLHQDEAVRKLDSFISDCFRRGVKKVLIIHGKGNHTKGTDPVLGELVRKYVEGDRRCGMSGHPKNQADGGKGATWVILRT